MKLWPVQESDMCGFSFSFFLKKIKKTWPNIIGRYIFFFFFGLRRYIVLYSRNILTLCVARAKYISYGMKP